MMTKAGNSATTFFMRPNPLKIFFDGGCRPNPGKMETAVVARGVAYLNLECGFGTNNDAEWLALIHAADIAQMIGARDVVMLGDSALVVNQANATAKCRGAEFRAFLARFDRLSNAFDRIKIRQISRHQNLAGIALAKSHM